MNAVLGPWHYESDGDAGHRTHYAERDDASKPCGTDRMDFRTAKEARDFVRNSNALIFRTLNGVGGVA